MMKNRGKSGVTEAQYHPSNFKELQVCYSAPQSMRRLQATRQNNLGETP